MARPCVRAKPVSQRQPGKNDQYDQPQDGQVVGPEKHKWRSLVITGEVRQDVFHDNFPAVIIPEIGNNGGPSFRAAFVDGAAAPSF